MKGKIFTVALIMGALLVGFALGQQVQADSFLPGSEADPLVAKSYLDEQLAQYVAELEQELAALRQQASDLQATVDQLLGQVNQ